MNIYTAETHELSINGRARTARRAIIFVIVDYETDRKDDKRSIISLPCQCNSTTQLDVLSNSFNEVESTSWIVSYAIHPVFIIVSKVDIMIYS